MKTLLAIIYLTALVLMPFIENKFISGVVLTLLVLSIVIFYGGFLENKS